MNSEEYRTEEQNQMRLDGLRVLARIIVRDLVSQPAQGSDSVAEGPHASSVQEGPHSHETPSVEGGLHEAPATRVQGAAQG